MNFEEILGHHLLDHTYFPLFSIGRFTLAVSKHSVTLWVVAVLLVLALSAAARGRSGAGRLWRTAVEAMVLYVRNYIVAPVFGHDTEAFLPYFLTLFFFILGCNLWGLLPGSSAVTGNVSVTAALALSTFVLINLAGIRKFGLPAHFKHLVPGGMPWIWWLSPLLIPLLYVIELIGLCAKCVALCIRLFANIFSGHIVSLAFLCMIFVFAQFGRGVALLGVAPVAVGLALFVAALDLLVALIQAYIFTLLTAVFVGMAVHPH
ncbi:MAG: F0F1 ATP synthase subunit A [Elusimicrobia bacterium]|nr:F0F1 ATP synthase subunit A [Elusimicrobiota bacterium]